MKPGMEKKSDEELKKELGGLREDLRRLRFDLAAGKVKNVRQVRKNRKRIAQILTLVRSRA